MSSNTAQPNMPVGFFRANFTSSFIYPLKGVYYFATHRYLHPLARGRLLPLTLLATLIMVLLFMTTWLPLVVSIVRTRSQALADLSISC